MKIILTRIFVGLGVIFLMLIMAGIYFFITDPYNLKPLIFGSEPVSTPKSTQQEGKKSAPADVPVATPTNTNSTTQTSGGFTLSSAQKEALVSLGIDPASVPSTINASQEACFTGVLGASRVGEIKAGGVPSALEFLKAKACI